jgi:hypothetical protein
VDLIMSVFQSAHVIIDTQAAGWHPSVWCPSPLTGSNNKNTETFPSNFYMKNLIIYTHNYSKRLYYSC